MKYSKSYQIYFNTYAQLSYYCALCQPTYDYFAQFKNPLPWQQLLVYVLKTPDLVTGQLQLLTQQILSRSEMGPILVVSEPTPFLF